MVTPVWIPLSVRTRMAFNLAEGWGAWGSTLDARIAKVTADDRIAKRSQERLKNMLMAADELEKLRVVLGQLAAVD